MIVNTYHYLRGGDSKYALGLARLLEKKGHEVHFFGMKSKKNLPCLDEQYFVREIDYREALKKKGFLEALKVGWRSVYSLEAKHNIARLLKNFKPDIVHLNSFRHHITISILPELHKLNIPVVQTLHDYKLICPNTSFYNGQNICEDCKGKNYINIVRNRCKKGSLAASVMTYLECKINDYLGYYQYIDRSISPSRFLRDKFIEYGYEPDKLTVVPNFIEVDTFLPHYHHEDYILFIGRLEKEKGLSTLIKAFTRATETVNSLRLKIAGTGSIEEELKGLIARMRLSKVELLGFKQGKELENLTKNAKAIVIPSEWYENYPFSCLEAMGYGKPIIASRIGGIPEQVEDGVTGFLFEPYNDEQLAKSIKVLYGLTKNRIAEMGQMARKKVERINNPQTYQKAILNIYEALLDRK
ncbi:MAG: glycosyltransferase family 4 protein [Candidatus Hodarchaeota archaeon]